LKTIAFVDHSFHIKSRATNFLIKILEKNFQVDLFWDDSWEKGKRFDICKLYGKKYHAIILFQVLNFSVKELRQTKCDNIIIIPMYDSVIKLPDNLWIGYGKIKFINFSKMLNERMKQIGIVSQHFQYFPPPAHVNQAPDDFSELKGFFWQRTSDITWNHIRHLISKSNFTGFHLHNATDPPGYEFVRPEKHEMELYNITISNWFEKKEDYLDVLNNANVIFCPRLYEGIGMSFLEAMAMGKCVVAPNNPTMNEYLEDKKTGYLYDPFNLLPIDFSNAGNISRNVKTIADNGYQLWKSREEKLIDFISAPYDDFSVSFRNRLNKTLVILKTRVKHIAKHLTHKESKKPDPS
jgi:glycosyltransferase involved in cell wall biosynthesis